VRIADHELTRLRDLAEATATVAAAYEAGVFAGLDAGPATSDELAGRTGLDARAVGILLPVLVELELLREDAGRYQLTGPVRRHLVDRESGEFEAGGLPLWLRNLRRFTHLPEVLASGDPVERDEPDSVTQRENLARFMAGMAAAPDARVQEIVNVCLERLEAFGAGLADRPRRMLDLGGGPGHMTRAFVERGLRGTLFDRPETVEFVADAYGLVEVEGLELVGGDFLEDPLPEGPFDVVLMSNVVHIYSPADNRELFRKVAAVTAPGGVAAVADFFRGRSERAVRFALVMLFNTEGGNTYTEAEIGGWLEEAGFRAPETAQVDADRHLITAARTS
jgi:SAM-dependent methyltransferase